MESVDRISVQNQHGINNTFHVIRDRIYKNLCLTTKNIKYDENNKDDILDFSEELKYPLWMWWTYNIKLRM